MADPGLLTIPVVVGVVLFLTLSTDYFPTWRNLKNILFQTSVLAIISSGMTFVIIGGGFDLSVGSVTALAGCAGALTMRWLGVGPGIAAGLAVGLAVGAFNGVTVSRCKVSPFIATLGTLVIARGLALALTGGAAVVNLPDEFTFLGTGSVSHIPVPAVALALVFLVGIVLLRYASFGVTLYAAGGNPTAARLSGIPVARVVTASYIISGGLAALAGLILAARVGAGVPTVGVFYELFAIAAVVLGGTHLGGGSGTLSRTLLGVLLIGLLNNGLNLLDIHSYWQPVVIGVVLILTSGLAGVKGLRSG